MTRLDVSEGNEGGEAIHVPREIANADSVFVTRWLVTNGERVTAGCAVCEIETSKAAMVVESGAAGYLKHQVAVGSEVPVGGVLGYVLQDAGAVTAPGRAAAAAPAASNISAKARRKIEELGLDMRLFEGRGLVREEDVLAIAAQQRQAEASRDDARGTFRSMELTTIQRRVARAMEQSVREVPACYLERTIELAPLRERAREVTQAAKALVSVADVIVAALARACTRHGKFNACFVSETEVRIFESVNVGVAVDIESDLYVAVVRDAGSKDVAALAKELRNLQYLAQRRRLEVEHLTGGTVTLTSMLGRGIHGFKPILFPQQTAILGVSDSEREGCIRLTLGFDHRVANGSEAAAFLAAIEQDLRS